MPIHNIKSVSLNADSPGGAGGTTVVATDTLNFPKQTVFAEASITTIETTHTPGTPSGSSTINAQIKSYTKANGTVIDLSSDPKNNSFLDSDVVSVTFELKVTSVDADKVWASGVAYLFG